MTSERPPHPPPSSAVEPPEIIHINRLPDELLLLIFTKLHNARSLCICNLVSKRFSTVVRHTPSILLTFPHRNPNSRNESNNNLTKKLFNYLSKSFFQRPPVNNFDGDLFQSAVNSLKTFQSVRDLRIELPSSFQNDESIIKWHAEFGRRSNICVILFATCSIHQSTSSNESNHQIRNPDTLLTNRFTQSRISSSNQIQNPDTVLTNRILQSRIALSNRCFREATWRQHILRHVVENHRRSIESVEICDSERKGTVVVKDKRQMNDLFDPEVKLPGSGYGKLWHVQVLRLPESRCVLYGATVVAIRRTDENEEEYEDVGVKDLMKKRCEEDEELVLWEVLSLILKNHEPSRPLGINAARI